MPELTPKQQRFVEEYLLDLNATQAAIRAGYSAKTANAQAARLLANVKVKAAIVEAKKDRSEKTGIDAAWLLTRLADEATADINDLYAEDGSLKPINEWPKVWRTGLVAGIETVQEYETVDGEKRSIGVVKKIKLADRTRIKELIGKHVDVQAFKDKVEHSGFVVTIAKGDSGL
jgi:phage terminase small subunit